MTTDEQTDRQSP